ncbi:MAG: hypothetical protein ACKVG9_08850 [Rhodospirillales bacterium]
MESGQSENRIDGSGVEFPVAQFGLFREESAISGLRSAASVSDYGLGGYCLELERGWENSARAVWGRAGEGGAKGVG